MIVYDNKTYIGIKDIATMFGVDRTRVSRWIGRKLPRPTLTVGLRQAVHWDKEKIDPYLDRIKQERTGAVPLRMAYDDVVYQETVRKTIRTPQNVVSLSGEPIHVKSDDDLDEVYHKEVPIKFGDVKAVTIHIRNGEVEIQIIRND